MAAAISGSFLPIKCRVYNPRGQISPYGRTYTLSPGRIF